MTDEEKQWVAIMRERLKDEPELREDLQAALEDYPMLTEDWALLHLHLGGA